jgi:hypothetical protein
MSKKPGASFVRRAPDIITEELVEVLSSKASFEFKALFDIILVNLRARNAASGGEEMLRLRTYEKLQGLVNQGAVTRTVTGIVTDESSHDDTAEPPADFGDYYEPEIPAPHLRQAGVGMPLEPNDWLRS